jgi:SAM-dependent MidA family methyltransferase
MKNQLLSEPKQPHLLQIIYDQINNHPQQRITFAEYMELALYQTEYGYYADQSKQKIGKKGDFITSVHWGKDFAELLAKQFYQMWQILGENQPFHLVEMGAGQGILADQICQYIKDEYPKFFSNLQYIIIEKSSGMRQLQRENLQSWIDQNIITWQDWHHIADHSLTGCCFSNELIDAFPVHQIIVKDQRVHEIFVTVENLQDDSNIKLQEIIGELSNPAILDYLQLNNINLLDPIYPDGYRTEVNLQALDWLKILNNKLEKGYILTIDYGYPAHRYYLPSRTAGTLQCYYEHGRHNDPYWQIGSQDITTHVNFTALEKQAELIGLVNLGFTQQGLFLMALGLGDRLQELSTNPNLSISDVFSRRETLHSLIDPIGLGGFGVLLQAKGLNPREESIILQGFAMPV